MVSTRGYRVLEASFVMLFLLQSLRQTFGLLLGLVEGAVEQRRADLLLVNAHLILAVALVLPWFAPRARASLPRTLMLSAILAAAARVMLNIDIPLLKLVAGAALIGFGGVYVASIIRANWRVLPESIAIGVLIDQLFRALDSYDPTLRALLRFSIGSIVVSIPWIFIQIAIAFLTIWVSWKARKSARTEPYDPGHLDVWGGLSLGSFLAIELLVLSLPGVIARWTGTSFSAVAPWLLLVTAFPLIVHTRLAASSFSRLFDERLRGWVWLLLLTLSIVAGNRMGTIAGAGALILAQFVAILQLWWMPAPHESHDVEQVGPSVSIALVTMTLLIYSYSLAFGQIRGLSWLNGQSLLVVLIAAILTMFPRLWWREDDPWHSVATLPQVVYISAMAVSVTMVIVMVGVGSERGALPPMNTLRIATYNINYGHDERGSYQLELIARTIEASQADVVVLQEVDAGRPVAFGVDQAEFLARRLRMYQAYQHGDNKLLGTAILSRYPVGNVSRGPSSPAAGSAGALRVALHDAGTSHDLVVVGGELSGESEEDRARQLADVYTLIPENGAAIIGVDLATSPQGAAYQQLLASGFVDPDVALGIERGFTYPASNPTVRVDYLLTRGLVPLASRQVDRSGSDHRLVVVEVGWP